MRKLKIKQNAIQLCAVFMLMFGASSVATQANAQGDLRQPLYDVCKARGGDEAYCKCMIGEPYDAFLHNHQYGGRDSYVETQNKIRATILQEPTMTEGRIKEICAVANMQFMKPNEVPKGWLERFTKLHQSLKAEYTLGNAAHMSIRNMMLPSSGYCVYGPKIESATKRANERGSFETHNLDDRGVNQLYKAFQRDQGQACRP